MQKSECFSLGKITKPHGLKGEVTIWLDVDIPENYIDLDGLFLEIKGQLVPYIIEELQIRGKKSIVKFEDINSIEATEPIIDAEAYLPIKKLPKLKGKQFYYHEVIGYQIFDNNSQKDLGELKAIYESTGQDLFAVDINETEVLIPIIDNFLDAVDHTEKRIHVTLPDGLLDIYLNQ
ncbi:ribosome maturation factor RimM [Lacihabitans soyangensis]|uniref:Ribosome maturation factor RimM n=1 Tax=Lacihabitans soyangensis TaxID=869394 RepID=A0AAE3H4G8_9BACT|nr:ribosome maturation factor RimM [Lacihabitans soyangensis]MCP9765019.1 16S rRNA processing protein RimM [Lacihabitans soyangensis]